MYKDSLKLISSPFCNKKKREGRGWAIGINVSWYENWANSRCCVVKFWIELYVNMSTRSVMFENKRLFETKVLISRFAFSFLPYMKVKWKNKKTKGQNNAFLKKNFAKSPLDLGYKGNHEIARWTQKLGSGSLALFYPHPLGVFVGKRLGSSILENPPQIILLILGKWAG